MLDAEQMDAPQFRTTHSQAQPASGFNPFSPMAWALLPLRLNLSFYQEVAKSASQSSTLRHHARRAAEQRAGVGQHA